MTQPRVILVCLIRIFLTGPARNVLVMDRQRMLMDLTFLYLCSLDAPLPSDVVSESISYISLGGSVTLMPITCVTLTQDSFSHPSLSLSHCMPMDVPDLVSLAHFLPISFMFSAMSKLCDAIPCLCPWCRSGWTCTLGSLFS